MDINHDYDWENNEYTNDLVITAENDDDYYNEDGNWTGNSILVKDFFNETTPNIKIKDKYHTYNVELKQDANEIDWSKDKNNHVVFLQSDNEKTNTVISNSAYNIINTEGGASLEYTYKGGIDQIFSQSNKSNDVYNINSFTKSTKLKITDNGGNDTLNINADSSKIRLLFDVYVDKNADDDITTNIGGELLLLHKDSLNTKTLNGLFGDVPWSGGIIRVIQDETIGSFITNDYQTGLNLDIWKNYVTKEVSDWLKNSKYNSSFEVFETGSKTDINALLKLYNVTYESIYEQIEADWACIAESTGKNDEINILQQSVAGWLSDDGYAGVQDNLYSNKEGDLSAMIEQLALVNQQE